MFTAPFLLIGQSEHAPFLRRESESGDYFLKMGHKLAWNERESTGKIIVLFIMSFLLPPVVAYVRRGCGCHFIVSLVLTCIWTGISILFALIFGRLGLIISFPLPLIIHALYLTFKPERESPPPMMYSSPQPQSQPQVIVVTPVMAHPATPAMSPSSHPMTPVYPTYPPVSPHGGFHR